MTRHRAHARMACTRIRTHTCMRARARRRTSSMSIDKVVLAKNGEKPQKNSDFTKSSLHDCYFGTVSPQTLSHRIARRSHPSFSHGGACPRGHRTRGSTQSGQGHRIRTMHVTHAWRAVSARAHCVIASCGDSAKTGGCDDCAPHVLHRTRASLQPRMLHSVACTRTAASAHVPVAMRNACRRRGTSATPFSAIRLSVTPPGGTPP